MKFLSLTTEPDSPWFAARYGRQKPPNRLAFLLRVQDGVGGLGAEDLQPSKGERPPQFLKSKIHILPVFKPGERRLSRACCARWVDLLPPAVHPGWLRRQKCASWQFWELEVQDQGAGGSGFS